MGQNILQIAQASAIGIGGSLVLGFSLFASTSPNHIGNDEASKLLRFQEAGACNQNLLTQTADGRYRIEEGANLAICQHPDNLGHTFSIQVNDSKCSGEGTASIHRVPNNTSSIGARRGCIKVLS